MRSAGCEQKPAECDTDAASPGSALVDTTSPADAARAPLDATEKAQTAAEQQQGSKRPRIRSLSPWRGQSWLAGWRRAGRGDADREAGAAGAVPRLDRASDTIPDLDTLVQSIKRGDVNTPVRESGAGVCSHRAPVADGGCHAC